MTDSVELWVLAIIAILATYGWRFGGVVFAARIRADGAIFQWVSSVSYALLAALVARMLAAPIGSLAEVPSLDRIGCALLAVGVFFAAGRRTFPAVMAGVGTFMLLAWGRQAGWL